MRVLVDIGMNFRDPEGRPRVDAAGAEGLLAHLEGILRAGQESGEFRAFATRPMAVMLRSAVDAASAQLALDPEFDVAAYTRELVTVFDLATAKERSGR